MENIRCIFHFTEKKQTKQFIEIKSDVLLCSQTEDYQGKRVYEENVQEEQ